MSQRQYRTFASDILDGDLRRWTVAPNHFAVVGTFRRRDHLIPIGNV